MLELVARIASIKGACNDTLTSSKRSIDNIADSRSTERGEKSCRRSAPSHNTAHN